MKIIIYIILPLLFIQPTNAQLFSSAKSSKIEDKKSSQVGFSDNEINIDQDILTKLNSEMSLAIIEINRLLDTNQTNQALTRAKSLIDNVRLKTGIHPKKKLREKFLVPIVFDENIRSINQLSRVNIEIVINTIADYRGGLFLDLINLSKRVSLLYIKAFQKKLESTGELFAEDRNKIISDLANANLFPIFIEDKKGNVLVVLAQDIANEDHMYLFNRELKVYLLENKSLSITEEELNTYIDKLKQSIRPLYNQKVPKVVKKAESAYTKGLKCISNAARISYSDDIDHAKRSCFYKYYEQLRNSENCFQLAKRLHYGDSKNNARIKCTYKFM